jgi:hypothetical protein
MLQLATDVTLKEAVGSFETSVFTRDTRRNIPENTNIYVIELAETRNSKTQSQTSSSKNHAPPPHFLKAATI